MKKALFAAVISVLCAGAARADMMDKTMRGVGGQVGIAIPGGDLGKGDNTGFTIGAHYYQSLQNNFGILPTVDYFTFGKKTGHADVTNTAIAVNGTYMRPDMADKMGGLVPMALLGLSYNMMNESASGYSHSDTGLGFNLGIGAVKFLQNDWVAGVNLSYKIFPDIKVSGVTYTGNAIVLGAIVGKKL